MKKTSIFHAAIVTMAFAAAAFAQDKAPTEAEKISKALDDAFIAAFNKGDAKALAALYAEDAQITNDDGDVTTGREEVLKNLTKFFAANKGAKLEVEVDSARLITPDVLCERGVSTVGEDVSRYTCTYVKKGEKWLIAELNETALPPADAASVALEELSWMAGSWKDNSPGVNVATTVNWTKNRHFLCRSITITREGEDATEATEIIGYDPVAGILRSWVFDSEGGFGEGTWKREGNKWLVSFRGTSPDGDTSSAQHVITYVDDKKFTWESINRQSEGEALPNIDKIEVIRTAAAQ